jgi:hypothetical protein
MYLLLGAMLAICISWIDMMGAMEKLIFAFRGGMIIFVIVVSCPALATPFSDPLLTDTVKDGICCKTSSYRLDN